MKIRTVMLVTVVPALLLLTACVNVGTSPSTRYYLLESKVEPTMATGSHGSLSNLSLAIGPVTIAAYLDRPQLVSRLGGNQLRLDDFHQWAEPLKDNITRVIQENLSVLTGAGHVYSYPKRRLVIIDYQIILDVIRFDADADASVSLKSSWRIVKPDDSQWVVEKRSVIIQQASSKANEDVVDTMSMALATLCKEVARALVDNLP